MRSGLRIASLLASGTEIVFGIGLGDQLVAVSHECDHPSEVAGRPRVTYAKVNSDADSRRIDEQVRTMCAQGEPLYGIDEAKLAALRPNVILTQAQCDVCAVRYEDVMTLVGRVPALRETRVTALNPTRLCHVFEDILRVAESCGVAEAGRNYVDSLKARVAAVEVRVRENVPIDQRVRVACLEWLDPPMLSANWIPDLIELAGGRCELTSAGAHSGYADWDEIRRFDPEVVVLMPCGFDLARTLSEATVVQTSPGWGELTAVQNGRVFAVDGNAYFNRSGPRMVDSLEMLAGIFHPGMFDGVLMRFEHACEPLV